MRDAPIITMRVEPIIALRPRRDARGELLDAIVREYEQSSTLALTAAQAALLWRLDASTCAELLSHLIEERILAKRSDGRYVRNEEGLRAALDASRRGSCDEPPPHESVACLA